MNCSNHIIRASVKVLSSVCWAAQELWHVDTELQGWGSLGCTADLGRRQAAISKTMTKRKSIRAWLPMNLKCFWSSRTLPTCIPALQCSQNACSSPSRHGNAASFHGPFPRDSWLCAGSDPSGCDIPRLTPPASPFSSQEPLLWVHLCSCLHCS